MKKIWITALEAPEQSGAQVQALMALVRSYGLEGGGHFWQDDLPKAAWLGALESLAERETALWIIAASKKSLESASVRYGLGLLSLTVQAKRGYGFPIFVLDTDEGLDAASLPAPLRGAELFPIGFSSLGAKLAARANMPMKPLNPGYRLDLHASEHFGLWFEVGPDTGETWNGALLGVAGGAIDFHGVGPAGALPHKAVLEYPMQGLTLESGGKEYTAWGVQNHLDSDTSYYVRVRDIPESMVFGPLEGGDGVFSVGF